MIERSESRDKIDTALSSFQRKAPQVIKEKLEKYGSLILNSIEDVRKIIKPLLREKSLVVYQVPHVFDDKIEIENILVHKSGQWVRSTIETPLYITREMDRLTEISKSIIYASVLGLSDCLGLSRRELGLVPQEFLK